MALLKATGLSVRFAEHHAVRNVDLDVHGGEVVGLIGPNGAGKTTIFNALAGVQVCEGTVVLDGVDISDAPPHRRARLGLNRTFQRLEVFGSMSAMDNILTAAEVHARATRTPMRNAKAKAKELIELLGLAKQANRRADALPTGQARLVELGRALATEPTVLLADEPASGLDDIETARLAEVLAAVADSGTGVLMVEHDMELVMRLCSTIHVLNFGEVIAVGTPAQVRADEAVLDAYLGAVT